MGSDVRAVCFARSAARIAVTGRPKLNWYFQYQQAVCEGEELAAGQELRPGQETGRDREGCPDGKGDTPDDAS